jgi:hypothetical protein
MLSTDTMARLSARRIHLVLHTVDPAKFVTA